MSNLLQQIDATGLFHATWYQSRYGAEIKAGISAQEHYITVGEAKGLRPNPYFDPQYYAAQKSDKATESLLLDYAHHGWKQGLEPSADFSVHAYLAHYPDIAAAGVEPLKHYLLHGIFEKRDMFPVDHTPIKKDESSFASIDAETRDSLSQQEKQIAALLSTTPLFDAEFYRQHYMSGMGYEISALAYYLTTGLKAGHAPNAYFDAKWYRAQYNDLLNGDYPIEHYIKSGAFEGCDPGPNFSNDAHRLFTPRMTHDTNPLAFYLEYQMPKGEQPSSKAGGHTEALTLTDEQKAILTQICASDLFDAKWYSRKYLSGDDLNRHPLVVFVSRDLVRDIPPNRYFIPEWYRVQYAEEIGDTLPLLDYITVGHTAGREPGPDFSAKIYYDTNPDLVNAGVEALAHYLKFGQKEGRKRPSKGTGKGYRNGDVQAGAKLPVAAGLRNFEDWQPAALSPEHAFDKTAMNIHWVIPEFSAGAGGHMTIFRMVQYLERSGHKQTIWINNPSIHKTDADAYQSIVRHFLHVSADVKLMDDRFPSEACGDAIIATGAFTVPPVMAATRFTRRFYFVQDYEPGFYATGSHSIMAEATYGYDIDCICASPWLEQIMREKYGRFASSFLLAADRELYYPPQGERATNPVPRIAIYSRKSTPRRAVELSFMALEILAKRGVKFEVDFFGISLPFDTAPFPFRDHEIATPEHLGDLFRSCDLGLVFSATNYSLVPQEMMACGLPVVELDGESTRAIFPEGTAELAPANPNGIADSLEAMLSDPARCKTQADKALAWVDGLSWSGAADVVEKTLSERLSHFAKEANLTAPTVPASAKRKRASVVIPTLNAGPEFAAVLDRLLEQDGPFEKELLVIDSGSTDETLDLVKARPDIRLHQIPKSEFEHAATRNLGVELTSGDYIAFLTQDALPLDRVWLHALVSSIEHFGDKAAGAFGKHYAYPEATPFTKRDLNQHFSRFDKAPLMVDMHSDLEAVCGTNQTARRQFLHYYSDNNSCMRRSVWKDIPYPRTTYGEDQLWAEEIIKAGYAKVYAPRAIVYHSHDFDADGTRERAQTEAAFFKHFFGYELMTNEEIATKTIEGLNKSDKAWAIGQGVDADAIKERMLINEARIMGFLDGTRESTDGLFTKTQGNAA